MEDEYGSPESRRGPASRPRIWTAEETDCLIQVWSKHGTLYNSRHPDYYKREKRLAAMNEICKEMGDISLVDITRKMENLRSYFGREKRKLLESQVVGAADVKSRWAYYDLLLFLDEHMNPKKPITRPDDLHDFGHDVADDMADSLERLDDIHDVYRVDNQQSPSSAKKARPCEKRRLDETIARLQRPKDPVPQLGPIQHRMPKDNVNAVAPKEPPAANAVHSDKRLNEMNDDMIFAEHVGRTIMSMTDELLKEDLKLQIQQCMCSSKRKQIALQQEQQRRIFHQGKPPNSVAQWRGEKREAGSPSFVSYGTIDSPCSPTNSGGVQIVSNEPQHIRDSL